MWVTKSHAPLMVISAYLACFFRGPGLPSLAAEIPQSPVGWLAAVPLRSAIPYSTFAMNKILNFWWHTYHKTNWIYKWNILKDYDRPEHI